ncbi:GNAT family N-acetyltransferase [Bacillus sp. DX4.1]|uniref:GNAT family N-acetyltransferase n=1 Tax=Bacillus sp. DX4.1 TaxID=3055867 RepID=UPI0025A03E23|nr:GNAT family N-acetyltransferase [Bacillus sp. DX4.1]MDM5188329.1 GNAT family N-acetyltransferase [Bacillus sp. DX4.1]
MQIQNKWNPKDRDYIRKQLISFNQTKVPPKANSPTEDVCLTIKNEDEEIVAGLTGVIFWQCLHVDILWIDENIRHHGYGSKLLQEAEKIAKEKKCRLIKLDTFSFQAPEFYKKHGFTVYGIVEDFPQGHTQYYLEKRFQ